MAGLHDGVGKLWILRTQRGLDVQGHVSEAAAIDSLIRHALTWSKNPEQTRREIEASVKNALTHLDETPTSEPDGDE